ncbi:MAG: aminotransferase class I/II-fold pyridoxal phosphate-dependent enzyme, partial [Ruminiclostridium sp.]|nr:aminotransferase class I/II-fold pyridoxal phosphate-dependent enzyme [Ruminiclostridium sp.]
VLIQPPVYNAFFHIIQDNEREIAENPLNYKDGEYSVDFEDLAKKLADPKVTMMILCNPHNPIGKIWDKETLEKIGELCAENGVIVVSDEIHCDLTDPGLDYVPFASISGNCGNNSITCVAPTKTFNLAGMKSSALIIPNDEIRQRVSKGLNIDCLSDPNGFACDAAYEAYTYGEVWLNQLRQYLFENKTIVKEFLAKELPQVSVTKCEATYLMWLNCENVEEFNGESPKFIREKTGLFLSEGRIFGKEGEKCMRMNVACTKETLRDALERLKKGIAEVENAACGK